MSIPDKNILTYIKDSLNQNFTRSQINSALLSAGWKNDKIEEAFHYLEAGEMNAVVAQMETTSPDGASLNNKNNNHKILKIVIITLIVTVAVLASGTVFFFLNKNTNAISDNIPKSKVVLSNINYSMVPFSKLINYKSKSISFEISNSKLAKKVCVVKHYYFFKNINNDLSGFDTVCNPYLSKSKSSYSDPDFLMV